MSHKRIWAAISISCSALLLSQDPPKPEPVKPEAPTRAVYSYTGKPIQVKFECPEEDITAFGLTCTEDDPCPVYLELSNVESVGNKLFLTGNLHTSLVTMWSILLASEDNGKTWAEVYDRQRSTGLEQIQFFDFERGWIGGQQLLSLPRDPFLLITDDGGKSWRKKNVYPDAKVGAIGQFSFESRNNGQLLIDRTQTGDSGGRHEFYETSTGGDSWSLRQVSPKPIRLKRPVRVNDDWRVRADAKTKSYQVERKTGERWQALAGFLLHAGDCKPPELKFVEPPLPTEETKPDEGVFVVTSPGGAKKAPTLKKKRP